MDSIEIKRVRDIPDALEKVRYFWQILPKELEMCANRSSERELYLLRHYYGYLMNVDKKRLRHIQNSYRYRIGSLVSSIGIGTDILDAGCGLGTESILCGILGAKVIGVDLVEERLDIASKRLDLYRGILCEPIAVTFWPGSIFDVSGAFDVIYAKQSISHIDPAERFLRFSYEHLKPGGKLIIVDENALNPYVYLQCRRARSERGGLYTKLENPRTGEVVSYAQERIFTVPSIKQRLINNGFEIRDIHMDGFCPYIPVMIKAEDLAYYVESLFSRLPGVNMFGACYTITARKRSSD
ncbi:MAG: class I SAM-dependent methyltransferase [Chloroflexota bacterium]|nr:class I SAM-dependent methyltransferase [Chloroflexota bacterium]